MLNNSHLLNEEERNRIINLHKVATKNGYLSQQLNVLDKDFIGEGDVQFWGVSEDGNVLFTNKNIFVVNEEKELKSFEYDLDSLPHIFNTIRQKFDNKLYENKITLSQYSSIPKRILSDILESIECGVEETKSVLKEWDSKFENTFKLIREGFDNFDKVVLIESLWDEVTILTERTWEEWAKQQGQRISRGFGKIVSGISSIAQKTIVPILKKGVIPFIRWIRRNAQTYWGIIVEVVASMFPSVVVVKVIYALFVLLDIYEILYDDFDPLDVNRANSPFIYLLGDIMGLLLTGAAGKTLVTGLKAGAKSPATINLLRSLIEKLPILKTTLSSFKTQLIKIFGEGATNFLSKIFNGIDSFITKITNWINKMIKPIGQTVVQVGTKQGLKKLLGGIVFGGVVAELLNENVLKEGMKGEQVKNLQKTLIKRKTLYPELKYQVVENGVYDQNTKNAVLEIQKLMNKNMADLGEKFRYPEDGILRLDLATVLSEQSGITIDLGQSRFGFLNKVPLVKELTPYTDMIKQNLGLGIMAISVWLNQKLGGVQGILKTK
jgi:DNA-binding ferritin-like protein (Dps family)